MQYEITGNRVLILTIVVIVIKAHQPILRLKSNIQINK